VCIRTKVTKNSYSLTSKYVEKIITVALHFCEHSTTLLKDKIIHQLQQYKFSEMTIERISKKVIIRLPSYINSKGLQRLVHYLTCEEATAKSKAKQADVDALAKEVKKGWWANNRSRLVK